VGSLVDKSSSPESSVTVVARLGCDGTTARRLADALAETFAAGDAAVAAFERPDGGWSFEAHFAQPPDEPALRALVGAVAGDAAADALVLETVAARDWVAASLAGLKPVAAGRFLVHGAHDRARVPVHRISIEIEAALAFGTGHHGTTRGCLLALDAWLKRRWSRPASPATLRRKSELSHVTAHGVCAPSPHPDRACPICASIVRRSGRPDLRCGERERGRRARILDIGTGTGVLAIAAAKALHTRVIASDIDRRAVEVARANARANAAGPLVDVVHAAGLTARRLRERGPFDLVLANILLQPLRRLAAPIARALAPGGHVILSGLLAAQAPAAIAAYRMQGLELEASIPLDEWVTLMFARRTRKRRE
jgi:ribosomal protein L11 methyltransferase